MNVYELTDGQIDELKQTYLCELADCGEYADVMGVDWDEPSWGELANARELVPTDVIYDKYDGVEFTDDDFFCSSNLN